MPKKASLFQFILKRHWPHWFGSVILGLINIVLTIIYKPWSITGDISDWGFRIWNRMGGKPQDWKEYFNEVGFESLNKDPLFNEQTILNTGLIAGVFLAVALAAEFRIKPIKSYKQAVIGLLGGILMGYGSRLSLGCNVGAMLGGISSQSLHGWVFGVFLLFGSLTGVFLLKKYIMKNF